MQITHSLYQFPIAKNVALNVKPTNFQYIFESPKLVLPVFQRKYCWNLKQLKPWWKDLITLTNKQPIFREGNRGARRGFPGKHSVGKFAVFESENKITIIDGQQRVTTTVIILCSIRRQLIQIRDKVQIRMNCQRITNNNSADIRHNMKMDDDDSKDGNDEHASNDAHAHKPSAKATSNTSFYAQKKKTIDEFLHQINKILYCDLEEFNNFEMGPKQNNVLQMKHGMCLAFVRFLPTFLDRQSLYNVILSDSDVNMNKSNTTATATPTAMDTNNTNTNTNSNTNTDTTSVKVKLQQTQTHTKTNAFAPMATAAKKIIDTSGLETIDTNAELLMENFHSLQEKVQQMSGHNDDNNNNSIREDMDSVNNTTIIHKYRQKHQGTHANANANTAADSLYWESDDKNNEHCIEKAKEYFDGLMSQHFSSITSVRALMNIFHTLLTKFTFVYIGIPQQSHEDKGFALYQWFFEKALMIEKALGNDRPGERHRVNELFKNYILSFFLSESLQKQNHIFTQWIAFRKCFRNYEEFDSYLLMEVMNTTKRKPESYDTYIDLTKVMEIKLKPMPESEYALYIEKYMLTLYTKALRLNANVG